jgi:hypothetical protein
MSTEWSITSEGYEWQQGTHVDSGGKGFCDMWIWTVYQTDLVLTSD